MAADATTGSVVAAASDVSLALGAYRLEIGRAAQIKVDALNLRARSFRDGASDADAFDADSFHGAVYGPDARCLVAFRLRLLRSWTDLMHSYTGQVYDLAPVMRVGMPLLEIGRFCHEPLALDPNAARLAWAGIGALVDRNAVTMLIGCSSFPGTDFDMHAAAFALLRRCHLGPAILRPRRKSPFAIDLPDAALSHHPLPPLLRSYLNMGGWVSDHVVKDSDLGTFHIFTGLDVATIPHPRKARLRALAAATQPVCATGT